jgi:DNA-binding IclR family transcriptional regulator
VTSENADKQERGSALYKAMLVLETVLEHNRPVGLPALAAQLGLPRQTVHRVLQQLEANGLLQRDQSRDRFTVGPRMTRLAFQALNASSHSGPTRAILKSLVDEIGETCNIGVLDGHDVVYVDRVECDWPLRVQLQAGSHVPAHCTSIGKMLLAHLGRRTRQRILTAAPLARYTENTITDAGELEVALAEIRKRGISTNNQEFAVGMISVAVPIRDDAGQPIAALAVHAPEARMSLENGKSHMPRLEATAARLARAWGYGDKDSAAA